MVWYWTTFVIALHLDVAHNYDNSLNFLGAVFQWRMMVIRGHSSVTVATKRLSWNTICWSILASTVESVHMNVRAAERNSATLVPIASMWTIGANFAVLMGPWRLACQCPLLLGVPDLLLDQMGCHQNLSLKLKLELEGKQKNVRICNFARSKHASKESCGLVKF